MKEKRGFKMHLENIIELLKSNLINLENIQNEIKKMEVKNNSESQAKQEIEKMLSPAIDGLFDVYDFISELSTCIDENDLENFLELTKIN